MPPSLFHVDRAGFLTVLRPAEYLSDSDLQEIIAIHPNLLGGDPDSAGDWIALERNGPSPPAPAMTPRWSVDHLFLNRDGVPTVVETRRDTSARDLGDLLGQILFYAANAEAWWPIDELRRAHTVAPARSNGADSGSLGEFIGPGRAASGFWDFVVDNLAAGRVRMVLVVDTAPPELTRMVDFLAGQLSQAEVWILEVKQHIGPSGRLLQTAIVGRSTRSARSAPVSTRNDPPASPAALAPVPSLASASFEATAVYAPRPANPRDAWAAELRSRCDPEELAALNDLLRWMWEQYGHTIVTDPPAPALWLSVMEAGKARYPVGVTASKCAAVHLGALSASAAYEAEDTRRTLVEELHRAGVDLESPDLRGDLLIPLKSLATPRLRTRVLTVFDGIIESLRLREAVSAFQF